MNCDSTRTIAIDMRCLLSYAVFIISVLCIPTKSSGQTIDRFVLASSGHYFEANGIKISATVGESFLVETFSNPSLQLVFTQGFQQYELNGALPVKLIHFSGISENHLAKLQWKVENEVALSGYAIEYAENGKSFQKLGFVPAKNNGWLQNDYSFRSPISENISSIFFRIKMLENDQSFSYSPIIRIQQSFTSFYIAPNPATTQVTIHLNSDISTQSEIKLYHISGTLISRQPIFLQKGINIIPLPIHTLTKGSYIISLDKKYTQRFIKN